MNEVGDINDQEWNKYDLVIKYVNEVVLKELKYILT